jgi:hypothetical protein
LGLGFKYALHLQQVKWNVIFNSVMKKIKLVVVLILLLFAHSAYCEYNYNGEYADQKSEEENKVSFEPTDFQLYIFGEVPTSQVLFNPVPETLTLFTKKEKSKELIARINHSKSKIFSNLVLPQYSFFSRYCSVFMHIFLKTACFRL